MINGQDDARQAPGVQEQVAKAAPAPRPRVGGGRPSVRVIAGGGAAGVAAGVAASTAAGAAAAAADAASASQDDARQQLLEDLRAKAKQSKRASLPARIARVAGIAAAALLLVFCLAFSAVRWWGANDAQTLQGTWVASQGGAVSTAVDSAAAGADFATSTDSGSVVITADSMQLSADVAYAYALDAGSKTLTFTFGSYSGQAHYRLSLDGNQLAIVDGQYGWTSSLAGDFTWTVNAALQHFFGEGELSPAGFAADGATEIVLTRAA